MQALPVEMVFKQATSILSSSDLVRIFLDTGNRKQATWCSLVASCSDAIIPNISWEERQIWESCANTHQARRPHHPEPVEVWWGQRSSTLYSEACSRHCNCVEQQQCKFTRPAQQEGTTIRAREPTKSMVFRAEPPILAPHPHLVFFGRSSSPLALVMRSNMLDWICLTHVFVASSPVVDEQMVIFRVQFEAM